jgi:regulator of sirC expression with transglutaminase-like and TPR domain
MDFSDSRTNFAGIVGRLGEDLDLLRASLYIADEDCGGINFKRVYGELNVLAAAASDYMHPSAGFIANIKSLSKFLSGVQGFSGNLEQYYLVDNIYFHKVLEKKKGIPISLSLVYMEVGRRLGIFFEPIGLPSHMLLRGSHGSDQVYLDPFNHGKILTKDECYELFDKMFGSRIVLTEESFKVTTKREFLVRQLANLSNIHMKSNNYIPALAAIDRMELVIPTEGQNFKDRSRIFRKVRKYSRAIYELECYLKLRPLPLDEKTIRRNIRELWSTIAALN